MARLVRPSLGEFRNLGELYDANTHRFIGRRIIKSEIPASILYRTNKNVVNIEILKPGSLLEKFNIFAIDEQLGVQILCDSVKVSGPEKFIFEPKESANTILYTEVVRICKENTELDIHDKDFLACSSLDPIEQEEMATHFVCGIQHGATFIACHECVIGANLNIEDLQSKIKSKLERVADLLMNNIEVNMNFSDLMPNGENYKMVGYRIYPNAPLYYTLLPVCMLRGYFNLKVDNHKLFKSILSKKICLDIISAFERIKIKTEEIYKLYDLMNRYRLCITDVDLKNITELKMGFMIKFHAEFKDNIKNAYNSFRVNKINIDTFQQIIDNFNCDMPKFDDVSKEYVEIIEKIQFVDELLAKNVKYIGKYDSLDHIQTKYHDKDILVFFYGTDNLTDKCSIADKIELWKELVNINRKNKREYIHVAVDLDVNPDLPKLEGLQKEPGVYLWKNGKYTKLDC